MNIVASAAMAIVACMGLAQGLYRSAQTLVILVLAGAIAFGLLGPASGILAATDPKSIWYYAADPFCLWALFCFFFLLLRTLAAKLFPNEPGFSPLLNQLGGALFGLATGYLAVGMCVLLVQMLPTSPELLGYEAFDFKRGEENTPDKITPAQSLWLEWDRGTLSLFGYLSANAMGSEETGFYRRYGDVYPPPDQRGEEYKPALNVDDVLCFYWRRRWEFFGPSAQGPIRLPVHPTGRSEGPGVRIEQGQGGTVADITLRLSKVERQPTIAAFPQEKPPADNDFLLLTLRFRPEGNSPRTIDSSRFELLDTLGSRISYPMVLGRAKAGQPQNLLVPEYPKPSSMTTRGLRFSIPSGRTDGFYLASGASFAFTEAAQWEERTLVFLVPKQRSNDKFHLVVRPEPAAAPPVPAAPKPAAAAPKPATAAPKPATAAPAAKPPGS